MKEITVLLVSFAIFLPAFEWQPLRNSVAGRLCGLESF